MSDGIIVFAHGSSVPSANEAVRIVATDAAGRGGFPLLEVAFLEASPGLDESISRLVAAGATRILVVPYFLTLGIHLQRDLPGIVERLSKRNPGVEIRVTPPLDGHPALSGIIVDRARSAIAEWKW